MASSNDRKISQLPLNSELKDDATFLIVSDIGTTPKNERINTQILFNEIPVTLSVGKELNGRDVIFNTTLDATKRFYFDSSSGDVTLGRDLAVANSVTITKDLTVDGTVFFNSITPSFSNLDITGNFSSLGSSSVGTTLTVGGAATFQTNATVNNNLNVLNNLSVTGVSTLTGDVTANNLTVTTANVTDLNVTGTIAGVQSLSTLGATVNSLVVNNDINSSGAITTTGNIFANLASLTSLSVSDNGQVGKTLTAENLVSLNNITANNLVTTDDLHTLDLQSPTATITNLNNTTLTTTDVHTANVNAVSIVATTLDVNSFTIDALSTNTFTANVATVANVVHANTVNAAQLELEIVSWNGITLPNPANYNPGTLKVFYDTSNSSYTLKLATSVGWQSISLS